MFYSVDEVMKYIEEEDVGFIRLAFRDAFGVQKNISVMPGEVRKAFEEGAPFNTRKIAGFEDCPFDFLYLKPDPSTVAILPWRPESGRVMRMFCDIYTPNGTMYEADTRIMLKRAVEKAKAAGISFKFGSETEFYLFKKDDDGNPTSVPYDQAGYMDIAPADKCENVRREISLTIERMGLTPERSHHEEGPGQNEIDFKEAGPLKAADQLTTFKMVVCTVADRFGLSADFSPIPLIGCPGNSYHINIYAVDDAGHDVVESAAAGILEKIRDITLFLNPSNTSCESEIMYLETYGGRTRAELRSPDAISNPYLVFTLLIHAGLYGIENHLQLSDETEKGLTFLPGSNREAVELAKASAFVKSIVPEGILKRYASIS